MKEKARKENLKFMNTLKCYNDTGRIDYHY